MAYSISFKSLRSAAGDAPYVVNIGGTGGTALKPGASTFVTQEDDTEDVFTPIRTQTGYLRIVDDGKALDGVTAFDWKSLIPTTDTSIPVTLTKGGTVMWQGFMQTQTFSGELYGGTQEREYPVQCALAALGGIDIDFNAGLKNFAHILKTVCDTIDTKSSNMVHIDTVKVQGGSDAQVWLMTKIDWQNFAAEDSDGIMRAKYSLLEVLEDMCTFWGWTARTQGTTLYLTCHDDTYENATFLTLTRAQLDTLAGGTVAGTVADAPSTVALSGDIFASKSNSETKLQGPHRAVVKADCNEQDTIVQFAPQEIRDWMEAAGSYTWVPGEEDLVGYFTTPLQYGSKESGMIDIESYDINNVWHGGFCRRQIFQSTESDNATLCDMMCVMNHSSVSDVAISFATKHPIAFSGGSLKISGSVWLGSKPITHAENPYALVLQLGIGMTPDSATWWNMTQEVYVGIGNITSGWGSQDSFLAPIVGNNIYSTGFKRRYIDGNTLISYPSIPVGDNIYGYIFVNILGAIDILQNNRAISDFEIGNLTIEFSRDSYVIPTSTSVIRPRDLKVDRVTSKEYSASNSNESDEEWNADCIFASDNNMKYGYGLLLDYAGNIISKVRYGSSFQLPEQHLANRVSAYWSSDKMRLDTELRNNIMTGISPDKTVSLAGVTGVPVAIGHDWRDDVMQMTVIEL
jgi:hypothetical protein